MGVAGAALATAASEFVAALAYLSLLLRRRLATWARLVRPPELATITPLLRGSSANLLRTTLWNLIMLARARTAQAMDPTGVAAAAYAITLQLYLVGEVISSAMQATASALVASALATSTTEARTASDRCFGWSVALGATVCVAQLSLLPLLLPVFSPVQAVREAAAAPAVAMSLVQLVNGPCYTAEGVAMGLGQWGALTWVTAIALTLFLIALRLSTQQGTGLVGVWASVGVLNAAIALGLRRVVYGRAGPLTEGGGT